MKHIYIDFTKGILSNSKEKFHGGGSFSRWIIQEILLKNTLNTEINLLINSGYLANSDDEKSLFADSRINIVEVKNIGKFRFEQDAILIFPLLPSRKFGIFKALKLKHQTLKVHVVVHGVRNIDLAIYDEYDKYYLNGILTHLPLFFLLYKKLKSWVEIYYIKCYLKHADKVFTVSNNSLQEMVKRTQLNFVKSFNQQSQLIVPNIKNEYNNDYILFVSAARFEKNFIRSLVAFSRFKEENNNDIYLYATGISEEFKLRLLKVKGINARVLDKWVRCFDYVSEQELSDLYRQSLFLLYTSKSEGYGIPLIESCAAGRPVVASYRASIPEVLGAVAYYVDPYSVSSVLSGIEYMTHPSHLDRYVLLTERQQKLLVLRQDIDRDMIIEDLIY